MKPAIIHFSHFSFRSLRAARQQWRLLLSKALILWAHHFPRLPFFPSFSPLHSFVSQVALNKWGPVYACVYMCACVSFCLCVCSHFSKWADLCRALLPKSSFLEMIWQWRESIYRVASSARLFYTTRSLFAKVPYEIRALLQKRPNNSDHSSIGLVCKKTLHKQGSFKKQRT